MPGASAIGVSQNPQTSPSALSRAPSGVSYMDSDPRLFAGSSGSITRSKSLVQLPFDYGFSRPGPSNGQEK